MISTRCCWPTVILSIRASGSTLRPKLLRELDHSLTSGRVIEEDARLVWLDRRARCSRSTVMTGINMKCWWTIPMPEVDRGSRRVDRHFLAVQEDLALVRVVEPVEDAHERRLAGAVLAEQGMDLTTDELEVDVVVGERTREALRDSAHLENQRVRSWSAILRRSGPRRANAEGGPAARPRRASSIRARLAASRGS